MVSSGIRLEGTPAMTTRGFKERFEQLAQWINQAALNVDNPLEIARIKQESFALTKQFPVRERGE